MKSSILQNKYLIIVGLILMLSVLGIIGYQVYKSENKVVTVKGWLLINNPETSPLTLENEIFPPHVWILSPKDVKWPGTLETNYIIDFTNGVCRSEILKDDDLCDRSKVMWGYGDRVTITGELIDDRVIKVNTMVINSEQDYLQW